MSRRLLFLYLLLQLVFSGIDAQTFTRVSDIDSSASSFPGSFYVLNNQLFFTALVGPTKTRLCVTDGTPAGTKVLKQLMVYGYADLNNRLIFCANQQLWTSDGTPAGTVVLKNVWARSRIVKLNNKLFFCGTDGISGDELWCSDGTAQGTQKIKEINPTGDGCGHELFVYNNYIYFSGAATTNNWELWRSDGTTTGTELFKEINITNRSDPGKFFIFNNKMFFRAIDSIRSSTYINIEPWVSDGTVGGTRKFIDEEPGDQGSGSTGFFTLNGALFFSCSAFNSLPRRLYKSDGTDTGTVLLLTGKDVFATTHLNNKLFYAATDILNDTELWVFDGTDTGMHLFKDIRQGGSSSPESFINFDNKIFFEADDGTGPRELWASDGTINGTQKLKTGTPLTSLYHTGFIVFNGSLYFAAGYDNAGVELWMYDPTPNKVNSPASAADRLLIYPNPARNSITIDGHMGTGRISIYNVFNQVVYSQVINGKMQVDISQLSLGMYIVYSHETQTFAKFVKL